MSVMIGLYRWLGRPSSTPILFLLYFAFRAAILLLRVEPTSDAGWYFNRGAGLAAGQGYSEGGVLTAFWPPGWPFVLALLFKVFGTSVLVAQIFNLSCSLLIGWLTMDLGRRLFESAVVGRAALLILAVYPNNIGYIPLVLTEVFYTMLILGGCWLLVVYRSLAPVAVAGLIFGLATLVKAQSLIAILCIFAVDLGRNFHASHVRTTMGRAVIVLAITFVVISFWSYRNYRVFGKFILVSTNGGLTLLTGNNPSARGGYTDNDPLVMSLTRTVATQVAVDQEATQRAVKWIKDNPVQFVSLMPLKIFRLWAVDGEAEWAFETGYSSYDSYAYWFRFVRWLNQFYYIVLLAGFAWAGMLLFSRKATLSEPYIDWWALPYAIALYPTAIALVFSGQSRFHYPVLPFVVMCCSWAIIRASSASAGAENSRTNATQSKKRALLGDRS